MQTTRCSRRPAGRLLLLPVLMVLMACGARMSAEERVDLARDLLARDDAATAVIHLKNALQADPSNLVARVLLAEASFRTGDYDSAAKEYLRAVDLGAELDDFRLPLVEALVRAGGINEALRYADPAEAGDGAEIALWRAQALLRAGRSDEARRLLEALSDQPAVSARARLGLARLVLANRQPAEALAELEPLAGEFADDADYWEVRALALLQSGDPESAAVAFRTAQDVVVDPLGTRRFMYRAGEAEAMLAAGRLEDARRLASGLHRGADRNPVANYLMARVELQSGDAAQALAHAQAILAVEPESSIGHMMAGAASMSLGQTGQAERHLDRAVASDPDNLPARKLLAQTRLGLQSPERALEALQPALGETTDPGVAVMAGVASVQAGDPTSAVEIFRRRLEEHPADDEARAMLAVSLMAAGRTEEALAELARIEAGQGVIRQRADLIGIAAHLQSGDLPAARALAGRVAEASRGNPALYGTLGALFQGAGQLDEAAAWFEETLALAPDNTAAAYNLGRINANRGRLGRAAELFEGILAREPGNTVVLTAQAQIDWAQGDRRGAIERLERARAADATDGGSRFVLTQYLVASGQAGRAVTVAREAADISPNSPPAINALGAALLEAGRPGEALPHFRQAHELNPLEPRYLLNAARAHAGLGELEPARLQLVNALALEPENAIILATLVDVERRAGRLEGSAQALARLENVAGRNDPRVLLLRGELLLAQQRYPDAEQAFRQAREQGVGARAAIGQFEARRHGRLADPTAPLESWLREAPADLAARTVLADYHLTVDDQAAAIREYESLTEAAPDNPLFLNNLAWLYGEAGDGRALALARRAHELAPDNAMIADTYGWLLHRSGEHARARELLAGAVAGAPRAGDIRYRYAVVLAETGDREAARREARAVLADTGAANYHQPAQSLLERLGQSGE